MKVLTEKQKRILDFIEEFLDKENMAPTVYEIADKFGIKTSTVFAHLKALQHKNQLTRSSKARSISLTGTVKRPGKQFASVLPVPIMTAPTAENAAGRVFIQNSLVEKSVHGKLFAMRVGSETMRELGINVGDIVVVNPAAELRSGDIVMVTADGKTEVMSYFPLRAGRMELRSANPQAVPRIYAADAAKIHGKIVALQRQY